MSNIGRNDPCPCGSGKKYKKCCALGHTGLSESTIDEMLADARQLAQSGLYDRAQLRYELLLQKDPKNIHALYEQGLVCCRLRQNARAAPLLVEAARFGRGDAGLCLQVANQLLTMGMAEEADRVASRALKVHPRNVELLVVHGYCLEMLNRLGEAIGVLQRAQQLSPGNLDVVPRLARCYRNDKQYDKALDLLDTSIKKPLTDDPRVALLWSELGMLKDKLGCYDEAFAAITRYGELLLASPEAVAIDSEKRIQDIDEKQQWILGGGISRSRVEVNAQARSPVFLVGFPRSGTTLTEQVLAAHPRIQTSEEQSLLAPVVQVLAAADKNGVGGLQLLELVDADTLQRAQEAYWQNVASEFGEDFDVFVDKLPLNILELGLINVVFPSAKIILALRDPRDVCISCFFQEFTLNPSMKQFLRWDTTTAYYARVMGFYQAIKHELSLDILEVRYADTVEDLPGQARRILDHLGLEWDESVLEFYRQTRGKFVNTPSYQSVREPVYKRAKGRWKNYPEAIEQALPDLQRFIDEFGYSGVD